LNFAASFKFLIGFPPAKKKDTQKSSFCPEVPRDPCGPG